MLSFAGAALHDLPDAPFQLVEVRVVHIVGPTAEDVAFCASLCKELMGKVGT